jgi:hypothetical protein
VAYTFPVRLRYVAMAYRIFRTPRKTIPPIAIFLVVLHGVVLVLLISFLSYTNKLSSEFN